MKTSLVVMAAGIGSRFGKGIKQLEPVGPNGEIIIDYSVNDGTKAGFDKVVFIIRKDLEKDFKEIIGDRISKKIEVEYAFQELENIPQGFSKGARTKPWGTGQAVLSCKGIVKEPFAVINADDFYGKESFKKIHDFLVNQHQDNSNKLNLAMAGFKLKNTLSENGGVTRGVCKVDSKGLLVEVTETSNIQKVNGKPCISNGNEITHLDSEALVSMNFWGLSVDFIDYLESGFKDFLSTLKQDDIKSEYLLPSIIDNIIKSSLASVNVLDVNDKWFGVTYKEDKDFVKSEIKRLHDSGVYKDLKEEK